MNSFLFSVNAVLPITLCVALGYVLKRIGLITRDFAKLGNNLVFRVFLPAMLFLNVYKIDAIGEVNLGFVIYALVAVLALFAISVPFVLLVTKKRARRGALIQATFRSNYALVGIPLAEALFGQSGVATASVLSAFAIPAFNILAVITLSIFSDEGQGGTSIKKVLLGIAKNPLIHAVALGIISLLIRELLVSCNVEWRLSDLTPIYKVLGYLSSVATPLALIVLGAQFEFSAISELRKEIIFGTVTRCLVVPTLGLGAAILFFKDTFDGAAFASFVALFATPVAVSSVPMAQEMKSDFRLAGQIVVWSTLFSVLTIFLSALILKELNIF